MKVGVAIGGSLLEVADLAARAESAGLESIWLAELDHSAFVQAAAAIASTERIGVGTAVALAFPRSPTITAMTAWDLDEMSGDRFMLGLGPQVKRVLEARFSVRVDKPAPQMREYVQAVRTIWAANRGEPVVHEGEAYQITMPTFHGPPRPERRDTPILLAAVGPVLSRVCGEVADGLLGHPLASPLYLREAVAPAIAAGLERSDRSDRRLPDHGDGHGLDRRRRGRGPARSQAPDRLLRHDPVIQADPGAPRSGRAAAGAAARLRQPRPCPNGRTHRRRTARRHCHRRAPRRGRSIGCGHGRVSPNGRSSASPGTG